MGTRAGTTAAHKSKKVIYVVPQAVALGHWVIEATTLRKSGPVASTMLKRRP